MDRSLLFQDLNRALNEQELAAVCKAVGIAYSDLSGESHAARIRSLIRHCDRQRRLPSLVEALRQRYPELEPDRYEGNDSLSWIDRLGNGTAFPPQITEQIEQLEDLEEEGAHDFFSLPEGAVSQPTARWDTPSPLASNPYRPDEPVSNPAMFYGRSRPRQQLQARLQNMGSAVIVGLPGMGKTSLLHHLIYHVAWDPAWRFLFAYLDLSEAAYQTRRGLRRGALEQWYYRLGATPPPPATNAAAFGAQVRHLRQRGYRPVLGLDGFGYLLERPSEFHDDFFERWRMLANTGKLALLVTATDSLTTLFQNARQTTNLDALLTEIRLSLFSTEEARALLREPIVQLGGVVSHTAVSDLLALAGPYPLSLQLAGQILFAHLQRAPYASGPILSRFQQAVQPYWLRLWNALTPHQRNLLSQPLQTDPPLVTARQYRQLARQGVLAPNSDGSDETEYRFFSHGFAEWVRQLG